MNANAAQFTTKALEEQENTNDAIEELRQQASQIFQLLSRIDSATSSIAYEVESDAELNRGWAL